MLGFTKIIMDCARLIDTVIDSTCIWTSVLIDCSSINNDGSQPHCKSCHGFFFLIGYSQEIEYWGINEFFLDSCCSYRFHDRKLESSRHRSWDDESDVSSVDTSVDEISDLNRYTTPDQVHNTRTGSH